MLPLAVLERAQSELTDWLGSGMSVLEVSHRGKDFVACAAAAEARMREVMAIPANYRVLFLQGGAMGQFAGIPMNLTAPGDVINVLHTGQWTKKAIAEAKRPAGQVLLLHAQRDHRRRRVLLRPRWRRGPTGGGHELDHPVATGRRRAVRPDLRRCTEEHGPCRPVRRHRPGRPRRARPRHHAVDLRLRADGRQRLDAQHPSTPRSSTPTPSPRIRGPG